MTLPIDTDSYIRCVAGIGNLQRLWQELLKRFLPDQLPSSVASLVDSSLLGNAPLTTIVSEIHRLFVANEHLITLASRR